jgi:hypothetical protein
MRNYEIIKAIYDRCPKAESFAEGSKEQLSIDQLFDRCLDIVDLIEKERPEIAKASNYKTHYPQREAGIDY